MLVERRGAEWLIHYESYSSEWDEVVGEDRIRPRGEGDPDENSSFPERDETPETPDP